MPTVASERFLRHISEADEAITIYNHLKGNGFQAEFSLRFVWICSVAALDDYVTQLILEKSLERFEGKHVQEARLMEETCKFQNFYHHLTDGNQLPPETFRMLLYRSIERMTFQAPDAVADGLAFIWNESNKWKKIGDRMGLPARKARGILSTITARRNSIAHSADFDEYLQKRRDVRLEDAIKTRMFIVGLMYSIEDLIDPT